MKKPVLSAHDEQGEGASGERSVDPPETEPDQEGMSEGILPVSMPVVDPSNYVIEGEIARGGQGRVLHARDLRLGRDVAIKLMLRTSTESVARFVREATITARLQHPGIVPVHEAGRWPTGELFYAMKRVTGRPLSEVIDAATTWEERLAMLPFAIAATDAIAYAHARGIVHRDVKPSNILVGEFGETLVVDWGVAKRLDDVKPQPGEGGGEPLSEASRGQTRVGAVVGTPAYMPPEQARGEPVDRRADVYALGASVYHMLAGAPPFESGLPVVERPPQPLAERAPAVPMELIAIVEKAMARRPEDRYAGAKELADDLKRFATGQLVAAHRYSTWALAVRWFRRHRAAAALTALFLVALGTLGAVSVRRVVEQRNVALAHQRTAEEANRRLAAANDALRLQHARTELDHDPTAAIAWLKTYPAGAPDWQAVGAIAHDAWARGVARHVFSAEETLHAVALSPDARRIAVVGARSLTLFDIETGAARIFHGDGGLGSDVAFSPDGRELWTSGGKTLARWDPETGASRRVELGREAGALDVSSDGRWLLARAVAHRAVTVRDLTEDREISLPEGAMAGALLPAGRAAIATPRALAFVTLETGASSVAAQLGDLPVDVRASPDGRYIAVSMAGGVDVFDARGALLRRLRASGFTPSRAGLTMDDAGRLVSCSRQGQLWVWDVTTGQSRPLGQGETACTGLRESSDGAYLVAPAIGSRVRVWDLASGISRTLQGHAATVSAVAISARSDWIASVSAQETRLYRVGDGDVHVLHGVTAHPRLSDGNRYLLTMAKETHVLARVDVTTGESRTVSGPRPLSWGTATWMSADGSVVVYGDDASQIWRWEAASGVARPWLRYTPPGVSHITQALSPDGRLFAGVSTDFAVVLVDVATGARRELGRHEGMPEAVRFSPDGSLVASAGRDQVVRVWDVASGATRAFSGHTDSIWDIAFSPDGDKIASASADATVRLWDVRTGVTLSVLRGHTAPVGSLDYGVDGKRVVSASFDGTLRIWDVATGEGELIRRDDSPLYLARFSTDGRYVTSCGTSATVWVSDPTTTPVLVREREVLAPWFERITSATVDAQGRVLTPHAP